MPTIERRLKSHLKMEFVLGVIPNIVYIECSTFLTTRMTLLPRKEHPVHNIANSYRVSDKHIDASQDWKEFPIPESYIKNAVLALSQKVSRKFRHKSHWINIIYIGVESVCTDTGQIKSSYITWAKLSVSQLQRDPGVASPFLARHNKSFPLSLIFSRAGSPNKLQLERDRRTLFLLLLLD